MTLWKGNDAVLKSYSQWQLVSNYVASVVNYSSNTESSSNGDFHIQTRFDVGRELWKALTVLYALNSCYCVKTGIYQAKFSIY